MLGFKWNPIFFGMNAAPISGVQIVNGICCVAVLRMVLTTAVYWS